VVRQVDRIKGAPSTTTERGTGGSARAQEVAMRALLLTCLLSGCAATLSPEEFDGGVRVAVRAPNFATLVWRLELANTGLTTPPNVFWTQAAAW
jgi:hypothetical protein